MIIGPNPSWQHGFARNTCDAAIPQTRKNLTHAWVPMLGPTSIAMLNIVGPARGTTNNTWTFANGRMWADYQTGQNSDVGDILDFTSNDDFSIVAFVASNGINYGHAFGRRSSTAGYQYSFGTSSTGKLRILYSSGSVDSTFSMTSGDPMIIAATHTSTTTELYLNNNYFSASSRSITHKETDCYIGSIGGGSNYFGKIGYVLVYNNVVSANLIGTLVDDPWAPFRKASLPPFVGNSTLGPSWYDIVVPTV